MALLAGLVAACGAPAAVARDIVVEWQPKAPAFVVGALTPVEFRLLDSNRAPVSGATLEIEAHMSHPGMAPVLEPATGQDDGAYRSNLALTMAGEWTLFVTGSLRDGRRIRQQAAVVTAADAVN